MKRKATMKQNQLLRLLEAPSQFLHLLLCLLPASPRLIFVARDSERADSTLGTVPWKCAMAWHKKIDCHGCHATKFFYAMTALAGPCRKLFISFFLIGYLLLFREEMGNLFLAMFLYIFHRTSLKTIITVISQIF